MNKNNKVKIGSRIKVTYKKYVYGNFNSGDKPLVSEFKGELFKVAENGVLYLVGYQSDNPSKLTHLKVAKEHVITIGGTRLPKYFSELLTGYIQGLKEDEKIKLQMATLNDKRAKLQGDLKNIENKVPHAYRENNKGKLTTKDLTAIIYDKFTETTENGFQLQNNSSTFVYDFPVIVRDFESKYLSTFREYDGQSFMDDFTQEDIMKHLKSKSQPVNTYFNLKPLEKYFTIEQEFDAYTNSHNDGTIDIDYTIHLTLKKSVKEDNLKDILALLNTLETAINRVKDKTYTRR